MIIKSMYTLQFKAHWSLCMTIGSFFLLLFYLSFFNFKFKVPKKLNTLEIKGFALIKTNASNFIDHHHQVNASRTKFNFGKSKITKEHTFFLLLLLLPLSNLIIKLISHNLRYIFLTLFFLQKFEIPKVFF